MSGMGEPDQIDMMTEHELRVELRGALVDLARLAQDAHMLQSRLDTANQQLVARALEIEDLEHDIGRAVQRETDALNRCIDAESRLDSASALLKRIWEFDVRVEGNGLPMDLSRAVNEWHFPVESPARIVEHKRGCSFVAADADGKCASCGVQLFAV